MYEEIRKNKQKSYGVVLLFTLIIVMVTSVVGYVYYDSAVLGGTIGGLFGVIYTSVTVYMSSKTMLRVSNGRRLDKATTEEIKEIQTINITNQLAMMADIPNPDIYIIEDELPNAFATGFSPDRAAIGVTTGLLESLNRSEIEAVIAHEIAHIQNYDIRFKTIVYAMGGFLVLIGNIMVRGRRSSSSKNNKAGLATLIGLVIYLFGELFSRIIQLVISRNREYLADATAVELTRNPQALMSALMKISDMEPSKVADSSLASMYFVNPFKNNVEKDSLWSTHPTTKNRINALNKL